MKKLISLLLVFALLFSLAACSSESSSGSKKKQEKEEQTEEQSNLDFSEVTVVDNDECTIKVIKVDDNYNRGFSMTVETKNKSDDITYRVTVSNVSINGIQCDAYFSQYINPGKKGKDKVTFEDDALQKSNIGEYTDIQLTFHVADSSQWDNPDIITETVHIYPYGEEKATQYVYEAKDGDQVLVDNDSVSIISTGYEYDKSQGHVVYLFIHNKTSLTLQIAAENVSVNGLMTNPDCYHLAKPGSYSFGSIQWSQYTYDDLFEEIELGDFTDIEFTIRAYDYDNWSSEDLANETVHIYPKGQENATKYVRKVQSSDQTLVNNEYATIIATNFGESDSGYTVDLFLANKTDMTVDFDVANVSINGLMASVYMDETLTAGKAAFATLTWYDSDFNGVDIGEFTDIEMTFTVKESENWYADALVNETIHIYPKGKNNATKYVHQIQATDEVLINNNYVTIIATGVEKTDYYFYVNLFIANKTNSTISVDLQQASINGVMAENYFGENLAPNKSAFASISFSYSAFESIDIGDFTDIELRFLVEDTSNWSDLTDETVHVYPEGKQNATQFVYQVKPTDTVLISNTYLTLIVTGVEEDDWGYNVNFLLFNNSDKLLSIEGESFTVNGLALSGYLWGYITPGKYALESITFYQSDLEANYVGDIEEIQFTFTAEDYNDWYSDYLVNQTVTIYP